MLISAIYWREVFNGIGDFISRKLSSSRRAMKESRLKVWSKLSQK